MHSSTTRGFALATACLVLRPVLAQYGYGNASSMSATPTGPPATGSATGYSTTTFNYMLASTYLPNNDYSNERLAFLWDQVGPVSPGTLSTTVSPTPEPTAYPNPGTGSLHPFVPSYEPNLTSAKLPAGLVWGVDSAAFQIEGAPNAEGKGPSIWDFLSHRVPNFVADNSTADIADDHYWLYKQDFARVKALGIQGFSLSISWPRIFPFGSGPVNAQGVAHYDDVIAELVKNGIVPAVTLFHWDTPLELFNQYGAWTDRQIVDDYFNYAKFIISRYDGQVTHWFTINEPQYCNFQYQYYPAGTYYPAYNNITTGVKSRFACGHYTLLAHAKVAKWYHEEFKGKGRITFKNSGNYFLPNSTSAADANAVQRNYDFSLGWFNHGPWVDGDYPQDLKDTLGDILPTFTEDEKAMIKGSSDFFAIDGYTAYYAGALDDLEACTSNSSYPGYPECANQASQGPDGFPIGPASDPGASWLYSTPLGVRPFFKDINKMFSPPDIMMTEFGFSEPFEGYLNSLETILWDLRRADYLQGFLDEILASIVYDKVNVTGIWCWAVFDNYEWKSGLQTKFGLQYNNITSQQRTPKASMYQFLNWFQQHGETGAHGSGNYSVKL